MPSTQNTGANAVAVDNSTFGGPNATQAANTNAAIAQPTSINSTSIAPAMVTQLPAAPTVNRGSAANASIPTPQSIINQGAQTTPAEGQQNSLLNQLTTLTGQQSSLATQQYNQENSAGVPALTKTVNDLTTQLQGLNDHATLLQNNASQGGLIQNTEQQAGTGLRSQQGINTLTNADLRNNQIQQATISAQSLTVKSALYAAQGSYSLAKQAADQAAQVAFDAQTQQINYVKAALQAIQPQLNKEEKAQADLQTAQLNERATQLQQQQQDFKTGQAMAIAAMQNNPENPAAQYAAQQAMQVSPTDPQYIQKVAGLVAQYQKDPVAAQKAILDNQLLRAQITKAQYDAKLSQVQATESTTAGLSSPVVQGWVTAIKNGTAKLSDITAAELKANPQLKNNVIQALGAGGSSATDILNTTKSSLDELNAMVSTNHGFTGATGVKSFTGAGGLIGQIGQFFGMKTTPLPGTQAADFVLKLNQVKNDVILPNLTLLHGLGRVTDREFQALTSAVTSLSTDSSQAEFKTELQNITDRINAKMAETSTTPDSQVLNGKTYVKAADGLYYPQ